MSGVTLPLPFFFVPFAKFAPFFCQLAKIVGLNRIQNANLSLMTCRVGIQNSTFVPSNWHRLQTFAKDKVLSD
jgi:hypothetical protein